MSLPFGALALLCWGTLSSCANDPVRAPSVAGPDTAAPPDTTEQGPIVSGVVVQTIPTELTTNLTDVNLAVLVGPPTSVLDPADVTSLKQAIELRDASGQLLATVVEVSAEPQEPPAALKLTIKPSKPLTNGWYQLGFTKLPSGYFPKQYTHAYPEHLFAGLVQGVRFAVGSAPAILAAELCSKGDGKWLVKITTTEPVYDQEAAKLVIAEDGQPCQHLPNGGGVGGLAALFSCPVPPTPATKWQLSLANQPNGVAGVVLSLPFQPKVVDVDIPFPPALEQGCVLVTW
jgi:hypothetical protein